MPQVHHTIGLEGIEIESIQKERNFYVKAQVSCSQKCPQCSSTQVRIKATYRRKLKHSRQGNRLILIGLRTHKYLCKQCGRYFAARIAGIQPRKRATENFRLEVFEQHEAGITKKTLSQTHQISTSTVESWYRDHISYRIKELSGRGCPSVLGIDEHFFTRKNGYATTLVDIKNHKVFDVVLGRSEKVLRSYFSHLKDKQRVRVVIMDLSESYRAMIKKHFPNAQIVSDRFHVVRLVNHHFLKTWQMIHADGRKNRGLLSLMRRHQWNLKADQSIRLAHYLKAHPALESVYHFKQDFMRLLLLKALDKNGVKAHLKEFLYSLNMLTESPLEPMQTLGNTLQSWSTEIVRMWRFRKTNSITEGLHNKMEMISRRAYGFRNFQNYRLRVLALCGWNGLFNRVDYAS